MGALPAMTPAELQVTKQYLGLSTKWLAHELVLDDRRLRRMEDGSERIPQAIVTYLDEVYEETRNYVDTLSAEYRRKVKATDEYSVVTLKTYRTDDDYKEAGGVYPAAWHRQVCARVAAAVPGLVLVN